MKVRIFLVVLMAVLGGVTYGTPTVERVLASRISGVRAASLSLDGRWDFRLNPSQKWASIAVPGEPSMQGFAVEYDTPMEYRRAFTVPADFAGHDVILRFDGVYSHARLWVNGVHIRDHWGGFTRWEADVTHVVKTGKANEIRLEVVDKMDDISYASGYAHHPIGGILRSVTLYASPRFAMSDFSARTLLDSAYCNADLRICYNTPSGDGATVKYTLTDPADGGVTIAKHKFSVKNGVNTHVLAIANPKKWNAEHPHLYTLHVVVEQNGSRYEFSRQIGFRKIEVVRDRMLVNGHPIKLRGACRHDIHPTLGRTSTRELDSLDVMLFKQSNMNFVRTSHYPPRQAFVEFCDRYGIYVECETAVCFVDTHKVPTFAPINTQNNPDYTDQYMSQCREMVGTYAANASVVLWSVGNESAYGTNFQLCHDWVKAADPTRPVIFSYPGSVPSTAKMYDILSMHYQDVAGNLNQYGMTTRGFEGHGIPALFDEWAHPACYTYQTLREDPNIREFWGQSLDRMWSGLFNSRGGLGGAIWGYIDETFMLPTPKQGHNEWREMEYLKKAEHISGGQCVGYGEWGIVDVWRRHKPEFWATKKAYSPIRLLQTSVASVVESQKIALPVHNRFDHTNLAQTTIRYTYNNVVRTMAMPSVEPHAKGAIVIPPADWKNGTKLFVEFLSADGQLIDAEMVTLGAQPAVCPPKASKNGKLQLSQTDKTIVVVGDNFTVPFDKATGLIVNATAGNRVVIESGPFLNLDINLNHLSGAEVRKTATKFLTQPSQWTLTSINHTFSDSIAQFNIIGTYNSVKLDMHITINVNGLLTVNYITSGEPNGYVREIGLAFNIPCSADSVNWVRNGYWSYYPQGELAANTGTAPLFSTNQSPYGEQPSQPWVNDTHNYFYWANAGANSARPLTQIAKSMKENIYSYALKDPKSTPMLTVISPNGELACRLNMAPNEQMRLFVNNRWDYPEIAWGNYCKTLEASPISGTVAIYL